MESSWQVVVFALEMFGE